MEKNKELLKSKYGLNLDEISELRKELHKNPEVAFKETTTKARLISYLTKHGVPSSCIKEFATTGFICDIIGKAPEKGSKKTIGLRAEMDAACIKEQSKLEYASTNPQASHVCGHDGHMAILLATADILIRCATMIPSNKTIRLIFQPAGETLSGAEKMISEGALEGVDEVYALHNAPLPLGKFGIQREGIMSLNSTPFTIEVIGKGTHGAVPQKGKDPITATCETHSTIYTALGQKISKKEFCSCCINKIGGGSAQNVITDKANMSGKIKTKKLEIDAEARAILTNLAEIMPKAFGCESHITFGNSTPSIINSKEQAEAIIEAASEVAGKDSVIDKDEIFEAADDFGFMTKKVPGAYMLVGSVLPEQKAVPYRSSLFDFNEAIIASAVLVWITLIKKRLECSLP